MDIDAVPDALGTRLGREATGGLLELLDLSHQEERETVIAACTERFERRLVEEISGVRVEIARLGASFRQEMSETRASLREDLAAVKVDLFKWCFMFWVGQVLAIGGMLGVMLRLIR